MTFEIFEIEASEWDKQQQTLSPLVVEPIAALGLQLSPTLNLQTFKQISKKIAGAVIIKAA